MECIASVGSLASEVVVCDMNSTDRTAELARACGARVEMVDAGFCDFGRLRHIAVCHAAHAWVLVIDADERMTPPLAAELRRVVAQHDSVDVVRFGNLFWYFGGWVWHGGFYSDQWIRFFRRDVYLDRYREGDEQIHNDLSTLSSAPNQITLPAEFHLEHYAYPSIDKYVSKTVGMYARVEGEQYHRMGRRFSFVRLVGEPVKVFATRFLRQRGYRDGMRGFILAVLFAAYRFTTWANVWLMEQTSASEPAQR